MGARKSQSLAGPRYSVHTVGGRGRQLPPWAWPAELKLWVWLRPAKLRNLADEVCLETRADLCAFSLIAPVAWIQVWLTPLSEQGALRLCAPMSHATRGPDRFVQGGCPLAKWHLHARFEVLSGRPDVRPLTRRRRTTLPAICLRHVY